MEKQLEKVLFYKAGGIHTEEIIVRIGIESGFYFPETPEKRGLRINKEFIKQYKQTLFETPYDGIIVQAFLQGRRMLRETTDQDEVQMFNRLGEQRYLFNHNLKACNTFADRCEELKRAGNIAQKEDKDLAKIILGELRDVRFQLIRIIDWLVRSKYEIRIISRQEDDYGALPDITTDGGLLSTENKLK